MPHLPDHATHDPELIAAFAAGDATGSALDEATALVAECADCAALHRDLRAIATALPELPAPARPRDFRLTPEQADALRPSGWRGLVAAFASPRFRLAAPLGTGLAAAGLAGLLLATPGGLFSAGSATSGRPPPSAGVPARRPQEAPAAGAPEDDAGGAALAAPAASPAPAASSVARTELDAATDDRSELTGPDAAAGQRRGVLGPRRRPRRRRAGRRALDPEAAIEGRVGVAGAPRRTSERLADALDDRRSRDPGRGSWPRPRSCWSASRSSSLRLVARRAARA